ncbi:MAG TPA: TolC family protein [Candidatus Tectomicrobia bacterium]|nr:TolC family protein [Candidatus Tectomicrobia bacterium]
MPLYIGLLLPLLLVILTLHPQVAQAQGRGGTGEYTIDELVTQALAENLELRAARAEVDAARGRLRQAALRPNPMLDLGAQQSVTGPDNNIMVGMTLPLELNRRKEGRIGVAERQLEMKAAQVADRERGLRADVRMKAGELLAARRNLRITEELLDVNRGALGLMRERVRRGAAPPLEENLMLVEVNRLDATRRILESRVEVFRLQLKTLIGLEPDAPLSIRGELSPTPVRLDRDTGLTRALAARPDLMVAQAEAAMVGAKVRKEEAEGRWDASINVGYMRQNFGYDLNGLTENGETRGITDIFHYIGGGVTVMLPLRNRNQGNIAAALAEVQGAARRLAFVTLTIRQEVAAAFTQYEAAQGSLEVYARGVREVARQNLEVVRRAYDLGRTSLLDVIAEQRRYIDIEMGYTESLKQVYDAVVDIERAVSLVDR